MMMDAETIYTRYMYNYPHKTAYRALTPPRNIQDCMAELAGRENELYIHLPFCRAKCGYCNLFSLAGQTGAAIDAYLGAIERQAAQYEMIKIAFSSLTIGGGTPLCLSEKQLERLFALVRRFFSLDGGARIAIETAPNETTREKAALLRRLGVSRVSMGAQSFQPAELSVLRRSHSADSARRAAEILRAAGFDRFNLDLIYGIPGQTEASFLASLAQALRFAPDELFVYPLYARPRTPLHDGGTRRSENAYALYLSGRDFLLEAGYTQLSMRRWAKSPPPTAGSCGFAHMISLGCGGRSYIGKLHFSSEYATGPAACRALLAAYIEKKDHRVISHGYLLGEQDLRARFLLKHLLHVGGVSEAAFSRSFGLRLQDAFPLLADFAARGYLRRDGDALRLTPEGLSLSDYIGPAFISPEVAKRMRDWEKSQ